jgi:hypothetical protein
MRTVNREVFVLVFEFILSIVVLIGSGFLLLKGVAPELAAGAVTSVITFWFMRRANDAANQNKSNDPKGPDGP